MAPRWDFENGGVKKETKFILERRVSQKCFNENGEKIDCDDILEPVWWWQQEKCLYQHGNIIVCDEFYLGNF